MLLCTCTTFHDVISSTQFKSSDSTDRSAIPGANCSVLLQSHSSEGASEFAQKWGKDKIPNTEHLNGEDDKPNSHAFLATVLIKTIWLLIATFRSTPGTMIQPLAFLYLILVSFALFLSAYFPIPPSIQVRR